MGHLARENTSIFLGLERSEENIWNSVRFNSFLWASVNRSFFFFLTISLVLFFLDWDPFLQLGVELFFCVPLCIFSSFSMNS